MLHEFAAADIVLHQPATKGKSDMLYSSLASSCDLPAAAVAKVMSLENYYSEAVCVCVVLMC